MYPHLLPDLLHAWVPWAGLIATALAASAAALVVALWPREALRGTARLVARLFYRIDTRVLDSVPASGGVLLVANHVSFLDAIIITAVCPRPVRFVMDSRIHGHPLLRPLFVAAGAIPIAPARVSRRVLARAHDGIAEALGNGEVVCIFPEGAITRDGRLAAFRPGVERILRRTPVPVVPVALVGLWGSVFSRAPRRRIRVGPRRRLRVLSTAPIPPEAVTAGRLQQVVSALLERQPIVVD